ncbi:MAG TPA: hypothetical protein VGB52_14905 [Actinomycetota bacterium]
MHPRRPASLLSAVVLLAMIAPLAASAAPGPNLLPNPGFELSALEPAPVPPYTQPQPMLPSGWIFEGAAGLFDHYPAGSGDRQVRGGQRAIAISIPASGKREQCVDQVAECFDNPLMDVYRQGRLAYAVTPHWRTAQPVTVTAGRDYVFSAHIAMAIVTAGEGATTFVRWLDATGVPIGVSDGPSQISGAPDQSDGFFVLKSRTVRAPAGAAGAIIALGHTDDVWIGQVRFDDVHFGTA